MDTDTVKILKKQNLVQKEKTVHAAHSEQSSSTACLFSILENYSEKKKKVKVQNQKRRQIYFEVKKYGNKNCSCSCNSTPPCILTVVPSFTVRFHTVFSTQKNRELVSVPSCTRQLKTFYSLQL